MEPAGRSSGAPHVALVAWGFPPSRLPGVYRGLALANELSRAGARVTVVTAEETYFRLVTGTDESLTPHVHDGIRVVRVPYHSRRLDPVINHWPERRVMRPRAFLLREQARETTYFPERLYGPWRPALENAVHRLHRADPVDLTVATGNPYTSYAAAAHLHGTFECRSSSTTGTAGCSTSTPARSGRPPRSLRGWQH